MWPFYHPSSNSLRVAKKILHGETEKRCLGKPGDVFQTSPTCCSSKSWDKFSSKSRFASITGSNFQIRCLDRKCLETYSTEKSFTKEITAKKPKDEVKWGSSCISAQTTSSEKLREPSLTLTALWERNAKSKPSNAIFLIKNMGLGQSAVPSLSNLSAFLDSTNHDLLLIHLRPDKRRKNCTDPCFGEITTQGVPGII